MPKWLKIKSVPLLIVSCLASVVIWLVIMSTINPTMSISFRDLDVTILGTTELYERNGFSILSSTDFSFDVEFTGSRNSILRLKRDDVQILCDVSRISSNGTNRVQCTVTTPFDDIVVEDSHNLVAYIEVDKIVEDSVKIRYELSGELPEEYELGAVTLPDEYAYVNGPSTEINNIAYGLVTADISDLRDTETLNLPVTLISSSGEPVELKYTQQITKNTDLNVEVMLIKNVTLTYTVNGGGGLTKDDVDITVSPSYITLVGDPDVLEDTDSISIGIIELNGIAEGLTYDETFWIPEGTTCTSNRSTATVDIKVKDIETRTYEISNIMLTGSVEGFDASVLTKYVNVRLRGNKNVLDSVSVNDFTVTVPLDQIPMRSGNYSTNASVSFAPSLNVVIIDSNYNVYVSLKPPAENMARIVSR